MKIKLFCTFLFFVLYFSPLVYGQSTFSSVRNIFSTYCTGSCHTASNPSGDLVLVGSDSAVMNALIMKVPNNATAQAKGDVLVMPGYPEKSFLLRKLNKNGWEDHPDQLLASGEGDPMPLGFSSLKDEEVELVRQWILFGCKDTGTFVDTQVLEQYYNGMGAIRTVRPTPPDPALGFQIRFGPFFVAPSTELEYNIKHSLNNADLIYVDKVDLMIHPNMHHFILEKFFGSNASNFPEGFRPSFMDTSEASTGMVISVQFPQAVELPQGSAYFWQPNTSLDLNGHVANVMPDSVLAIEAYINVYYDAPDPNVTEMYSDIVHYRGILDKQDFFIPPGEIVSFTDSIVNVSSDAVIDLWMLTTHTHKYGLSYNIYERAPCGGKGDILYNGNYDRSYEFDQGFFDYEHPALRIFDTQVRLPIKHGIIHEATFYNYGADTVYFGLTTKDEMMNFFFQYTLSPDPETEEVDCTDDTLGISNNIEIQAEVICYPNPFNSSISLIITDQVDDTVDWHLLDLLGRSLLQGKAYGSGSLVLDMPRSLPSGQYILVVDVNGQQFRKLLEKQ